MVHSESTFLQTREVENARNFGVIPAMAAAMTSVSTAIASLGALLLLVLVMPLLVVLLILFKADGLDPAPLPDYYSWFSPLAVPAHNDHILHGAERLLDGLVTGPEDLVYDPNGHFLYTGCEDGWIKRIRLTESFASISVENWTYTGGRPLGLAIGANNQLIVADAHKGLLRVTKEGRVEVLTDEADGVKFGLINCVDVTRNGMIYFTDTTYKYRLGEHMLDFLEGRPHGRLMSFDPYTNHTQVIVQDLYFANGVALSPGHHFLVFCETILRRCRRYHIQGDRKGTVDDFIDNLPGFPDNIHFDGNGLFWIAFPSVDLMNSKSPFMGRTFPLYMLARYPFLRKALAIWGRFLKIPNMNWSSGVIGVSLQGKPVALYTDQDLSGVTSGVKVGRHLYFGSLVKDYISRLDLTKKPRVLHDLRSMAWILGFVIFRV